MRRFAMLAAACAAAFLVAVPFATAGTASTKSTARPAGAPSSTGAVCGLDKMWLRSSTQTDLAEIDGASYALKVTHNPAVIRLAETVITDHTLAYHQAVALAQSLHVDYAKEPSPTQQWDLAAVREFKGDKFNRCFSSLQIYGHMPAITEATNEANNGCYGAVRDNARAAIPMLQMHLMLAEQALKTSGGSGRS